MSELHIQRKNGNVIHLTLYMYVREAVKERILLLKEKEIAYITLELENVEPTCSSFSSLKHVLSFLNWSKWHIKTIGILVPEEKKVHNQIFYE